MLEETECVGGRDWTGEIEVFGLGNPVVKREVHRWIPSPVGSA